MGLFGGKFPADKQAKKIENELLKIIGDSNKNLLHPIISNISYTETSLFGCTDSLKNNEVSVAKVQLDKAAETIKEVNSALELLEKGITGALDQKKTEKAMKSLRELRTIVSQLDKQEKDIRTSKGW